MIVCEPEIKTFKIQDNFDFIMIGCDGIFERLNNKQTIDCVWDRIIEQTSSNPSAFFNSKLAPKRNANSLDRNKLIKDKHHSKT